MPQLSIYIDKATLNKLEQAAKNENKSISKWAVNRLKQSLDDRWPDNFFDLFGSIKDDSFRRQDQMSFENDVKRDKI
jgi:hypothetical protein